MRVLYVEDDPASVQLVATVLRRRGGRVLVSASTGQAGLRLAAGVRPDLVLLDLDLPDMTGETVLRRLQGASPGCVPPVVVVSADARPETAARLLAAGATHFLTKPLDLAELERRLDAAISVAADEQKVS